VHFGENKLAFFRATNLGSRPITGRALFNVLPEAAGPYFSKLECFCFKNQTLAPGQSAEFPVVYTVDHRYAEDRDTRDQTEITLSYTFFPAADPSCMDGPPPARGRTTLAKDLERSCIRPLIAADMAAGPQGFRGSGSNHPGALVAR
jgi:cytochrome c oxidase assembly protein Cox11